MAETVIAKFREITSKTYADQAKWYLNAFWADIQNSNPEEPEQVWKTVEAFIAVDLKNGKNGNELNEVLAHHFLQKIGRTLTALQLRAELRKIDLDANGEMALIEYLLFEHKRDVVACCNNPQGGGADPAELKAAEEQLNKISEANDELQVKLVDQKALEEASKVAEAEAKKREAEAVAAETAAKASEAEALAAEDAAKKTEAAAVEAATQAQVAENKLREAEDAVRVIEAEAKAVDAELQAEKDKYNGEIDRLTALTTDDTVGIVKRNMAVQQLAQLKGSDPMPLQKAKITQEAVVRRVAKARTAAEAETAVAAVKTTEAHAAREVAEADRVKSEAARAKAVAEREAAEAERAKAQAARTSAEQAREAAEEGTRQIEAAIEDIQQKMKEAEEALQKLKSIEGSPHGAIWWMEREITEKKKYLPQRFQ